jgi:hypothetical protein
MSRHKTTLFQVCKSVRPVSEVTLMRPTSVIRLLIALALLVPPPAVAAETAATPQPTTPTLLAQAPTPPPPAGAPTDEPDTSWLPKLEDPPYPGGAIIDSTPPNAIVLSLDDTMQQALKNNLSIAVSAYDPEMFSAVALEERAVFDPIASGYYYKSNQESQQ